MYSDFNLLSLPSDRTLDTAGFWMWIPDTLWQVPPNQSNIADHGSYNCRICP